MRVYKYKKTSLPVWLSYLGFFSLLWMWTSATADPEVNIEAGITHHIPVVFSGDIQYQPFHFIDRHGKPTGFDVELFHAIAERKNLTVDNQLGKWDDKLKQLEIGTVDVIPMFVSEGRQHRYLFSKPFLTQYHLMFGHAHGQYLSSLDDLQGQRIAVQYGGLAWETLRTISARSAIIPVNVESDALVAVAQGEADYALVPMTIGYGAIIQHNLKNIIALSPPLLQRDYAFAVTPNRPDLIQVINEGLMEVQLSGEQDQLYIKWLANLISTNESYRSGMMIGIWIVIPLLLCTIIIIFWWQRAKQKAAFEANRADKETVSRQTAEARALHLAFHDAVTGLPNRNAFDQAISTTLTEEQGCALVRLDLLGLDLIHALAGNAMSQNVLNAVAERLVAKYGKDYVADLGNGKFVVRLEGTQNIYEASEMTQVLINLVNERYQLNALPIEIRCRAGLAIFPHHAKNGETLFRAAELACIHAQESELTWCIFESALEPDARNLTLLADLQDAISDGTLGYAVQPQLDLETQRIISAELLVRWNHPRFGPLPPNVFVPLAERTGAIGQMTMYLVLKAIAHCQEWQEKGINISLSVNVSGNDLADETLVKAIIEQCGDVGHLLILEVTETQVMLDTGRVLASVNALRAKGVRISLDDFGTGYSSFSYLQRLNPDELKIDRSFITNLSTSPSDQAIVRSIILLAHELKAKVVAEGIEDISSMDFLRIHNCDFGQGYAIARPMPVEELISRTDLA